MCPCDTPFFVEPIAELLGVDIVFGTKPEFKDGHYTGDFIAPTCFAGGKITLLQDWLKNSDINLSG